MTLPIQRTNIVSGDIPPSFLRAARESNKVAIDIETTGLDYRTDQIGSIQLFDCVSRCVIVRPPYAADMKVMRELLADRQIAKTFHHAMFDLRFLRFRHGLTAVSVSCTKVAAKIVLGGEGPFSLSALVSRYLGIELDKSERTSDWLSVALSASQLEYALSDTLHLPRLLNLLMHDARRKRLTSTVKRSFDYIPVRVELDICGVGDVFVY